MKMSAQVAPCAAALTAPFARIPCGPFPPQNPHNIAESCLHFICKIYQTLLHCNSVVQQKSRCNRCADQQRALLLLLLTCAQVPHVAKTGQRRCGCRACHRLASAIALQKAGVRACADAHAHAPNAEDGSGRACPRDEPAEVKDTTRGT